MTLSNWIKGYCTENGITLPDDIPDENTALEFINVSMIGIVKKTIPDAGSLSFDMPNNSRAILITIGTAGGASGAYLAWCNASGTVGWTTVKTASNNTLSNATNKLTITTTASGVTALLIRIQWGG